MYIKYINIYLFKFIVLNYKLFSVKQILKKMASKRLMGVGNIIMRSRGSSANNMSNILDKSINTTSTYETPKRQSDRMVINPIHLNKKEPLIMKRLSTEPRNNSFLNNISSITGDYLRKSKILNINYLKTEPRKESSKELLSQADQILKDRTKNNLNLNLLQKSAILDKTRKLNLENYKIKLIKNRQIELNTRVFDINNALKLNEKNFEKDYRDFLNFVDKNNRAQKRQEEYMAKLRKKTEQTEKELNEQNIKIKKLRARIENVVKKILVLKNYGSFVNKLFQNEFIYDKIKREEGWNYFSVADDLIKVYEQSNKQKEEEKENEFKLNEQEYETWLIKQFTNFENSIINLMSERNMYRKEIINIQEKGQYELEKLNRDLINLEKDKQVLNNNEEIKKLQKNEEYTPPELMENVLNYIDEFAELLDINTNTEIFKDKTPTNYVSICHLLLNKMSQKEDFINDRIETFENLMNSENANDRNLIEKIISDRKKEIKREKFLKLVKIQKEETKKNNMKMLEKMNKFVIKWRKIDVDYPLKKKKVVKKIVNDNHDDDILYYSSDENN